MGLIYVTTALPSVICSYLAGDIGNRFGRWVVICGGMVTQGAFFALGPKDLLWVEFVSLVGLGVGMGLVDGTAPSLLAQIVELFHGGTGVVYTLANAATQIGFFVGPVGGSAIMQASSFQVMSLVMGGAMVLYAPSMLVCRSVPQPGEASISAQIDTKSATEDEDKASRKGQEESAAGDQPPIGDPVVQL